MSRLAGRCSAVALILLAVQTTLAQTSTPPAPDKLTASIRPGEQTTGSVRMEGRPGNVAKIKLPEKPASGGKPMVTRGSQANPPPAHSKVQLELSDQKKPTPSPSSDLHQAKSIPTTTPGTAGAIQSANFLSPSRQELELSSKPQQDDDVVFFPESRAEPIFIEPQDKLIPAPFKLDVATPPSPNATAMSPQEQTILQTPNQRLAMPPAGITRGQNLGLPPTANSPMLAPPAFREQPPSNLASYPPQNYIPFSDQQFRSLQTQPTSPSVNLSDAGALSYSDPSRELAPGSPEGLTEPMNGGNYLDLDFQIRTGTGGMFYSAFFLGNHSLRDFELDTFGTYGQTSSSDGFLGGLLLGLNHGPNLRSDVELAYRTNEFETVVGPTPLTIPLPPAITGDLKVVSGMSNVYWDINSIDIFGIRPYVGAGIGFAYFDTAMEQNGVSILNEAFTNDSSMAYQWLVGVNGQLARDVDWFVEYRYFNAGDVHIRFDSGAQLWSPNSATFDYVSNSVLAGLKLKF